MMLDRRRSAQESYWILYSSIGFIVLRAISLTLHFLGPSPYGGSLVESPQRFVFNAILIESGVFLLWTLIYRVLSWSLGLYGWGLRLPFLLFSCIYLAFAQFDLELVRWLGEHATISFLRNYLRKTDGVMLRSILASDKFATSAAALQMMIPLGFSVWVFRRKMSARPLSRNFWIVLVVLCAALLSSPQWLMPSSYRWRRICPVVFSLTMDGVRYVLKSEYPQNIFRAYADLHTYMENGEFAYEHHADSLPRYPLYRSGGPGKIDRKHYKNIPRIQKPNFVLIVFESWRGWKTGLVFDTLFASRTPLLDSIIRLESYYFPYVHSLGFPSVEGAQDLHLGVWPHFRKIIMSSYNTVYWKSMPEILRDFGYRTEMYVGSDPSFTNFTQWFRRWYDYTEYSVGYAHDEFLVNRLVSVLDTISRGTPFLVTAWTTSTHPPYQVPFLEKTEIKKKSDDERYDLAIAYAERQIVRFIDYLKRSDLWEYTVLILVGDHAQPDVAVRNNPEIAGVFTPGHTWTHIALLGGWPGLVHPKRNEETVPLIDLPPTILELANISAPNHFMGKSLLHPRSREFLGFYNGIVAVHRETERILFDMHSPYAFYTQLDKTCRRDYALLGDHQMARNYVLPRNFDRERYRDMIFAYSLLLDENRLFPRDEQRPYGVYVRR